MRETPSSSPAAATSRARRVASASPSVEHSRCHLTELAAGRDHEHHPVAGRRGSGDHATGDDHLVVGMRMERHEGAGHARMSTRDREEPARCLVAPPT